MHARVIEEAQRLADGFPPDKRTYLMAVSILLIDFYRGLEREGVMAIAEIWTQVAAKLQN